MPRRKLTPEQLEAKLHQISRKDLVVNLIEIEKISMNHAYELANLEEVAKIYRKVAEVRGVQTRCGQG